MVVESPGRGPPRRKFMNWLVSKTLVTWLLSTSVGGLLAAILYPTGRYLVPPKTGESAVSSVTLPIRPQDVAPDTGRIFKFGNRPGILVRTPSGELRAFTAVCTHLSCTVQYRPDLSHIWCACHNGHFGLNGVNIAGPPPRPLEPYLVNVLGDRIIVSKRG